MVEKLLIIFSLIIFLLAMLATARYYLSKKKFINLVLFIVFLFIQISPLLVFSFNRPSDTGREEFKKSVYEKCMNEKRESKQFCADISSWETRKQYDDVAYGSFMLFAIFVVTPISGLSMKLATILILIR